NNGDIVTCQLTSTAACANPTIVNSNSSNMIVFNAVTPTISIVESANNICQGISVTYTASITNGGTPSYQWIVNGTNVGTNSNTYTYIPNNVDIVACQLTSTANCAYPVNVTSNLIIMYVNMVNVPSVTINQIDTNICEGSAIACLASYSNAGNNPVKRWIVNEIQFLIVI
ncbi:MAG: hypothetical protein IPI22_13285, partial [Bacteroidetes bacterium]|nr:hypothetical protein [Bacteroidota bacterium]